MTKIDIKPFTTEDLALQEGPTRIAQYLKVSIFRFADYRKITLLGKMDALTQAILDGTSFASENVEHAENTSWNIGTEDKILKELQFEPALPLYGKSGTDNLARPSSRGQGVQSSPFKVRTIGPIGATNEPGSGGPRSEVVGTITRASTSKSLGDAAGSFSITAAFFAEWMTASGDNSIHKFVDSGDWVEINVIRCSNEDGPDSQERVYERNLMVGKVDTVSLAISPPTAGGCRVTIDGRDSGSVWADIPLYFNVYDPARNNAIGENMIKALNDVSGRPDEIVMQMLGLINNPITTYGVPPVVPDYGLWTGYSQRPTMEWRAVWSTRFVSKNTRGIISDPKMLTPNSYTPLWDFVETYGVPQLNEIWVDTLPSETGPLNNGTDRYSYLFMREKPFVTVQHGTDSPWFELSATTVWLSEIKSTNLRRGGDRYNHINVLIEMPSTLNDDVFAIAPPIADFNSILRYGLKKLDVTLPLFSTDFKDKDGGIAAIGSHVSEYRDLILCWNVLNAYYWSGSISLVGIRGDIRVGDILIVVGPAAQFPSGPFTDPGPEFWQHQFKRRAHGYSGQVVHGGAGKTNFEGNRGDATTFYVEAVSYTWGAAAGNGGTTITVSRGYVDKDRLPHITALSKLWVDATNRENIPESTRPDRMKAALEEVRLLNEANTDDGRVPALTGATGGLGPDDPGPIVIHVGMPGTNVDPFTGEPL